MLKMKKVFVIFVISFSLVTVTSSLQCYKCYSEMSAFDCIYKQQMVTCEAGYHSCATFSEMYFGKKVYHKFCKNSNLTCEALCTGYQRNGRKCLETDKISCCQADLCNKEFDSAANVAPKMIVFLVVATTVANLFVSRYSL